jgi:hypothetical protein
LALLVVHDQPHVSTAVVSKALARSEGENGRACGASQVSAALESDEDQRRQTVMARMPGRTAQCRQRSRPRAHGGGHHSMRHLAAKFPHSEPCPRPLGYCLPF